MTDDEIKNSFLRGIRTIARMENIWYNNGTPDNSFEKALTDLRKTLEHCLALNIKLKDKEK